MNTRSSAVDIAGLLEGLAAQLLWGLLPIFWKLLNAVAPLEIVAHRILWSLVFMLALTRWFGIWQTPTRRQLSILSVTALLIGTNWLLFIWSVQHGRILESSLGYFINPLVSVLLGVAVLKERLSRQQGIAILLAFIAVMFLILYYGQFPWIALGLAFSFSAYALLRKRLVLSPLTGTLLETALLAPVAIFGLIWFMLHRPTAFISGDSMTIVLLLATGVITAIPLILNTSASKRLPFTTLGLLQYLAPSCQFLVASLLYREPLENAKLSAFVLIWLALIIYAHDTYHSHRNASQNVETQPETSQ